MVETVVFDVGGVLVDWDPRHLYRSEFRCEDEMERFLAEVCTWEWHHRHDAGVPFAESIPALADAFPAHASMIRLWDERYMDMVPGEIPGVVDVVRDLHARGTRLLVLSNMPAEVWPQLTNRFEWFELFATKGDDYLRLAERERLRLGVPELPPEVVVSLRRGCVVSGVEKVVKPDPAIYRVLVDRHGVDPASAAFVDDRPENVEAASALGFDGVLFTDAASLREALGV